MTDDEVGRLGAELAHLELEQRIISDERKAVDDRLLACHKATNAKRAALKKAIADSADRTALLEARKQRIRDSFDDGVVDLGAESPADICMCGMRRDQHKRPDTFIEPRR